MRRHRRARQETLSSSYEDQNSLNSSTRGYGDHQILGELPEDQFMPHNVIRGPSSFDPFDSLPLRIQPYMIELLSKYTTCSYERLYSIEKYADYNPMRDYFLPMAFKDLALFHAILFSSVCLKTLTVKEVPKAVAHLKECIRLVNQRLRSPSPVVADSTILIVLMVAYTEKLTGHHKNWEVHMQGLKQMVRLRGGLKSFESNWVLHSLILRNDLYGSVDALSEPYFEPIDLCVIGLDIQSQSIYESKGFQKVNGLVHFRNDFNWVLCKIEDATRALNSIHIGDTTTNPLDLRDELTSMQYVLLRMELARHSVYEHKAERICRLGVLLYLVTILNDLLPGASTCNMFATTLRVELGNMIEERTITPEFRWWVVLLIGGIVSDEVNKLWAKNAFERIILDSPLSTRHDIKETLAQFFWVEKIHGEKFAKLWDEALAIDDEEASIGRMLSKNRLHEQAQQQVEVDHCNKYGTWLASL